MNTTIKVLSDQVTFGSEGILAVGDLYQLPPVAQAPLFSTVIAVSNSNYLK